MQPMYTLLRLINKYAISIYMIATYCIILLKCTLLRRSKLSCWPGVKLSGRHAGAK